MVKDLFGTQVLQENFILYAACCRASDEAAAEIMIFDETIELEDFSEMDLCTVVFENCSFDQCSFSASDFQHVSFRRCSFSGCSFSGGWLQNCSFSDCRLTGSDFSRCGISDVEFEHCDMGLVNFTEVRMERCAVLASDLTETFFARCRLKKIKLEKNRLIRTEFFETMLRGLDFSTSELEGIKISTDNGALRGAKFNLLQAAELAKMLGIILKM